MKESTESKKKKSRSRSKEETNGEGGGGDSFWDSKWEGMQLDEKLRKAEHKGRYYLNTEKRYQDTMGDKARDDSVSLSPSPERVDKSKEVTSKKKGSDSESDTEEFKRLKEMKKVQNFVVKGDGMVEGPIADTSNFEYDPVTRMYKKKDGLVELETRRNYKDEEKKKEDDKWKSDDELEREKKENEKKDSNKDEAKKEDTKKEVDKDEIMDELVKEIEELENEVDTDQEKKPDTGGIDWGSSALEEIITEKEKEERKKKKEEEKQKKKEEKELKKALEEEIEKFRKSEDGEISDGVEDGEVSSGDERKRTKYTRASKRSRSRSRTRRRSYSRGRDSRDRYSSSRSYRRRSRSFSRDRYSSRRRSPYDRERERDYGDRYSRRRYSRSRSRTRSRSRSRERRARAAEERYERMRRKQERHLRSKINKEKLLEIAKKNANKILKSGGDFMGMDQDRLVAMKAGGSSLDELTKFCKELAKKGLADGDRIDMLAESESDSEEEFHHPFMVKDKPLPNPITMMIGEQKETLTPTARAVAKSQRMLEFPVSSGNAHRTKADGTTDGIGEWEPVQTSNTLSELARPALVAPIDIKDDDDEMLKFHEQMEQEEKDLREEAAKTLWTLNEEDKDITVPKGKDFFKPTDVEVVLDEKQLAEIERLKPKPSKLAEVLTKTAAPLALPAPKLTTPLDVTEPEVSKDPNKVFDTVKAPVVDIGTIVSRRLTAMRKLQANPSDAEALAEMYEAQQMMSDWAGSKNKPGQFVGSTGARVLSKGELNLGLQCWAKADQFHNAEKVKGGFGEFMLKKMGWKDGEGLGRFKSGEVNPLTLDIKFDKKGLMAAEETKKGREVVTMTACKDLSGILLLPCRGVQTNNVCISGKHPVSALTELCSKRRWGPPIFTQAFECGPPHKKQYVYKVCLDLNKQNLSLLISVFRSMLTVLIICQLSPWITRRRPRLMLPWPASSRWDSSPKILTIQSRLCISCIVVNFVLFISYVS